jgi:hypothetical protein
MNRDFRQLRRVFDGDDSFMAQGHQISKLQKRERLVPDWTRSNEEVRRVLLRSFPKLATDAKQRERAARWARIIHLYFRLQYTYRQVAEEIGIGVGNVKFKVASIRRVAAGKSAQGKEPKPRGRPKIRISIP